MKSVAAVYARLDRAARGVANGNLSAWMGRRTDDAVRDVIARALTHAAEYRYGAQNRPPGYGATPKDILRVDPPIPGVPQTRHGVVVYARPLTDKEVYDYELAPYLSVADVVAAALVKLSDYGADYAALIRKGKTDVFRGVLDEGTPFYTDTDYAGIERAVSAALLAKYPAAPVPVPVAPVPVALAPTDTRRFPAQGFAASTLDAEADGLRDSPDEDDGDEDDAAIRAVVRAYAAGKRKALVVARAEADAVIAGLTVLANTEDERAEAERKRPASKRDPERARMTRAASDGLSALSTRIFKAFR